ncbi:MAG TPA: AAA family ATPase [Acidiferrobacterales bacterium]|nr:AAA family ATPase [Acidiferrobacterales bacterium]
MSADKQTTLDRLRMLPPELREGRTWLVWRGVPKPNRPGKIDKVPYYTNGNKRAGTQGAPEDVAALATFDDALAAYERDNYSGIGRAMLGGELTALDFDNCVDEQGKIDSVKHALVEGTYTEISPSGRGLRAFYRGNLPDAKNHDTGVEVFHASGFVTITGNRINGAEIIAMPDATRAQIVALLGKKTKPPANKTEPARDVDWETVRAALKHIPADERPTWLKVGMALHHANQEAGREVWDEWAQQSTKFAERDQANTWRGFSTERDRAVTVATIFKLAREHGWAPSGGIAYRRMSSIEAEHIKWLWLNKIARGKMTALAGDPGLGKSQATVSMAAVVSTGGRWPVDRSQCTPGSVVILSAEDGAADTIRPRLEAAGADLTRCYVIDAVREVTGSGNTQERGFSLDRDAARLGDMLAEIGDVALVIVDPISAYLGKIDSHNNAEVRGLLAPLSKVVEEYDAALVMVSHLTKGQNAKALMKIMGSLAFVAAARAAYVVCRDPDDESGARRLFLPVKNNLAPDTEGLAFKVEGVTLGNGITTSRIMWESDAVTTTADEAMAPRAEGERAPKQREAEEWLRRQLAGGAMLQAKIEEEAAKAGLSMSTVRIARKKLNVHSTKAKGAGGAWSWALPSGGDNDPTF